MRNTVIQDDGPDLEFDGEVIAKTETSSNNCSSNYSGSTGRWTELRLYRTVSGKYVASRINKTQWQGESDTHEAKVCKYEADVIAFFGYGALAKEIYYEAGIKSAVTVD